MHVDEFSLGSFCSTCSSCRWAARLCWVVLFARWQLSLISQSSLSGQQSLAYLFALDTLFADTAVFGGWQCLVHGSCLWMNSLRWMTMLRWRTIYHSIVACRIDSWSAEQLVFVRQRLESVGKTTTSFFAFCHHLQTGRTLSLINVALALCNCRTK